MTFVVSKVYASSSKMELDVHPRFSRNAVSLVAQLPFDVKISCFRDLEVIPHPPFLALVDVHLILLLRRKSFRDCLRLSRWTQVNPLS